MYAEYAEYECETCDREFHSQHAANQHMNARDHWWRRYDCETCRRDFNSQDAADQHMDELDHWADRYDCETCDQQFYSQWSATRHMDDASHWMPQFECETCDRRFRSENSAIQHMNNVNHWAPQFECETCNRTFHSQKAVEQHMDSRSHWSLQFECESCYRKFRSQNSANQHMDDMEHWAPQFECDSCDRTFRSQNAVEQHMNDTNHWAPQFECEICDRRFGSYNAAQQHIEDTNHFKGRYCRDCKRGFQDENSLKMHFNSSIHRGKNVACPFCKAVFTSASGLSHHLENGSCSRTKNLNRDTIYRAIRQRDPDGFVTKKLITYSSSNIESIATSAAWNGYGYECYLCHEEHDTLRSLNRHLSSLFHSEKLYHCPNHSCGREFVSLGALFNHLESESCQFVRFEKVQQNVHNFITGRQKLLGFV